MKNLDGILFVSVNGMPFYCWDPKLYVMTWLKSGRHSAADKPFGKAKRKTVVNILLYVYFSNLHNVVYGWNKIIHSMH